MPLFTTNSESQFIGKDPDTRKDWRKEEKGATEDEMVGWHHQLKGHEFEQTVEDGEGQGGLACCSPWGCEKSDIKGNQSWIFTGGLILKLKLQYFDHLIGRADSVTEQQQQKELLDIFNKTLKCPYILRLWRQKFEDNFIIALHLKAQFY